MADSVRRANAIACLQRAITRAAAIGTITAASLLLVWPVGAALLVEHYPWPWWIYLWEWSAIPIVGVCWAYRSIMAVCIRRLERGR
ncbi:MAG: hypothetical protein KGK07_15605 [Chloroflexota bacterium]|nr:hypothetical protein [Chloroflexota bacterium]